MGLQDEPVLFSNTLEALAKAFGPRLTPQVLASLKELGIDLGALMPAYPLYQGEEAVKLIARSLYPDLGPQQSWERMGQEWLRAYLQTLLGRAALAFGRTVGFRRALERMPRNFKTASNYLSCVAVVHGQTDVELRTFIEEPYLGYCRNKPSVLLHYRVGVLRQAAEEFRAPNAHVAIESWDASTQTARYRIRWDG